MVDIDALISGIEDFYEVWSDGFDGDSRSVAERLAEYRVSSRRAVMEIMKTPTMLVHAMSREHALRDAAAYSHIGLKCRLVHVGKSRLDVVDDAAIEERLSSSGAVDLSSVYVDRSGKHILQIVEDGSHDVTFDVCAEDSEHADREFTLYLACLRYLLRRSQLLPGHSRCGAEGES